MAQELKAFIVLYNGKFICVYPENKVNKVLAEKDKEIAELKQKLESVQASMYADLIDSGMENRRLQRAVWLARAERAMAETYSVLNDVLTSNRWVKALNKLKAKAEAYK